MRAPLLLSLALVCSAAHAGVFQPPVVSEDSSELLLFTADTGVSAPETHEDQDGFEDPQVSPDGQSVGWIALVASCCTSYPLPRAIVIYRDGEVVQKFDADQSIWEWRFAQGGEAVAYAESVPHGLVPTYYHLKRISDGKTLSSFECYPGGMEGGPLDATYEPEGDIPEWVKAFRPDACRRSPDNA